jgi:hypothetical protein
LLGQGSTGRPELLVAAHDLDLGRLPFAGENDVAAAPGGEGGEEAYREDKTPVRVDHVRSGFEWLPGDIRMGRNKARRVPKREPRLPA